MLVDVTVPALGESITEGTIVSWNAKIGDPIQVDEPLLEVETDKITAEVPSPVSGTLKEILVPEGDDVEVGAVVARIEEGAVTAASPAAPAEPAAAEPAPTPTASGSYERPPLPAARKLAADNNVDPSKVAGTGRAGQVRKEDVARHLAAAPAAPAPSTPAGPRGTRRVPMTRLRRRIAERLLEAQHGAAILTTFNEVDMGPVMALRSRYKEAFIKRHGVKLGFMSFFVKAAIEALKAFPKVNAAIDGDDLVYNDFYDIGVAVSSEHGLVVPVIRDADSLGFADVEKTIADLGRRARDRKLGLADLTGGTFTISNGGIFGSMLSTPILNPPQSAILGMHNIVQRPVVRDGEIVVAPVMYLALSYDHRIIDGREAVRFLYTIKELIEDPSRILLEV